jgi:hypothetical protein
MYRAEARVSVTVILERTFGDLRYIFFSKVSINVNTKLENVTLTRFHKLTMRSSGSNSDPLNSNLNNL